MLHMGSSPTTPETDQMGPRFNFRMSHTLMLPSPTDRVANQRPRAPMPAPLQGTMAEISPGPCAAGMDRSGRV